MADFFKLGPDYYKLGKTERLLYLSGVPMPFLSKKIDPKKFVFRTISTERDGKPLIINAQSQAEYYQKLSTASKKFGFAAIYTVGSSPTSQPSYDLAAQLSIQYYNNTMGKDYFPKIKWVDLGNPDFSYLKDLEEFYNMIVIHGLSDDSDPKRLELAKDFLRRSGSSTVFILATTTNILEFSERRLAVTPHIVLQLGKTIHRTAI